MSTLTIRNVPEESLKRLKKVAAQKGCSMEQELRELIASRYVSRKTTLKRMRSRWKELPSVKAKDLQAWRSLGRK